MMSFRLLTILQKSLVLNILQGHKRDSFLIISKLLHYNVDKFILLSD